MGLEHKMEYLKEFSEAVAIGEKKKGDLEKTISLVRSECLYVEKQYKTITDLYTGLSRRQNEIDSEDKRLEIRFNELDSKERVLEGREKRIDLRERELHARECEADGKEKSLSTRQSEIESEAKRLMIGFMSELDSKEIVLEGREKEIDSREKQLHARENEADGKEKNLSRWQSEIDSEAKMLMIRFTELDSKEKNVEGRLKEIDAREKQLDSREHDTAEKEIFLSRRKSEIESKAKKLVIGFMSELDSKEMFLEGREKEIDSREKQLHAREREADVKEKNLSRRQREIDSEAKKLMERFSELDSKEKFLEGRENDVTAKEKILAIRENELDLKEFTLATQSTDVESRVRVLVKREISRHSELEKIERKRLELLEKAEEFVNRAKEHGLKEQLSDLNHTLGVPENSPSQFIQEPVSRRSAECAEGVNIYQFLGRNGKKRCFESGISDASQQMNMEGSSSQQRKRNRSCGSNGQLHPHDHQKSDSMGNFAAKSTGHPSSFDIGTEKGELGRNVNIGDVWACFDSKYELPRSYAKVRDIFDMDGKDWLSVVWLKPRPVYDGENEWINADLPVTCGTFYSSKVYIARASPSILCHPVSRVRKSPWTILPCERETWAIYKDWDITTWSSHPNIHRNCEYEIVEIVSHHQVESTCGVRVAYLDKIMGSQNSFQRRSYNGENSFLIDCTRLYRFSHRVRSVRQDCIDANGTVHCVFQLDQKCLPEEFR